MIVNIEIKAKEEKKESLYIKYAFSAPRAKQPLNNRPFSNRNAHTFATLCFSYSY